MSRGKKLDIFIGAKIDEDWSEVQTPHKTNVSQEIYAKEKHFLVFQKEKRRGKTVTLVGEFHRPKEELAVLLKTLKKKLGCGGSLKDSTMEFQGELQEKIRLLLIKEGFRFKHRD